MTRTVVNPHPANTPTEITKHYPFYRVISIVSFVLSLFVLWLGSSAGALFASGFGLLGLLACFAAILLGVLGLGVEPRTQKINESRLRNVYMSQWGYTDANGVEIPLAEIAELRDQSTVTAWRSLRPTLVFAALAVDLIATMLIAAPMGFYA